MRCVQLHTFICIFFESTDRYASAEDADWQRILALYVFQAENLFSNLIPQKIMKLDAMLRVSEFTV